MQNYLILAVDLLIYVTLYAVIAARTVLRGSLR